MPKHPNKFQSVKNNLKRLNANKWSTYPNERYRRLMAVHCVKLSVGKSEMLRRIIYAYLDKIPESTRAEYMEFYKSLTKDQLKYPARSCEELDGE